jgi:copper transport protein
MVDPAMAGANTIHLDLLDRHSGRPFRGAKEVDVTAALPAKRIAPIPLRAERDGAGRYMVMGTTLAPAGDWRIAVTVRVSDFDEYAARLTVPIH